MGHVEELPFVTLLFGLVWFRLFWLVFFIIVFWFCSSKLVWDRNKNVTK